MFTRKRPRPLIRDTDYCKLIAYENANVTGISQFKLAPANDVTDDIAGLDSIVTFTDIASGVTKTVQIVEPKKSDDATSRVSALSPLGQALLGSTHGDHIDWQLSGDVNRILEITVVIRTPIGNEVIDDE